MFSLRNAFASTAGASNLSMRLKRMKMNTKYSLREDKSGTFPDIYPSKTGINIAGDLGSLVNMKCFIRSTNRTSRMSCNLIHWHRADVLDVYQSRGEYKHSVFKTTSEIC